MKFVLTKLASYTLFQNGHHLSVLLFACKLALASFEGKYSFELEFKKEAARGYLKANKIALKWQLFWNEVYAWIQGF